MKIAILTDSSYDGKIDEYKDLYLVPLIINTEDGRDILDDNNLAKDEFYELLDNQMLKTSQATPGQLMKVWDELLVNYDQIIYLPISKGLSGQCANAKMLSEIEETYKGKVFVCDGNNVSIITQKNS